MNRKILSVGHMEFPLGQAQVQRQLLMAKAITLGGRDVTVLCRKTDVEVSETVKIIPN